MHYKLILALALFVILAIGAYLVRRRSAPPVNGGANESAPAHAASTDAAPGAQITPEERAQQEKWPRIAVIVQDAEGKALPGAEVLCAVWGSGVAEGFQLPDFRGGSSFSGPGYFRGSLLTDSNGSTLITVIPRPGLTEHRILISASAKGFVDDDKANFIMPYPALGTRREVVFKLNPGCEISGKINGLAPEETRRLHCRIADEPPSGDERDPFWFDLPEVHLDGSFVSKDAAPRKPLRLKIYDPGGVYLTYRAEIRPPLSGPLSITLERNPEHVDLCEVDVDLRGTGLGPDSDYEVVFCSITKAERCISDNYDHGGSNIFPLPMDTYYVVAVPKGGNANLWGEEIVRVPSSGKEEVTIQLKPAGRLDLRLQDTAPEAQGARDVNIYKKYGATYFRVVSHWIHKDQLSRALSGEMLSLPVPPGDLKLTFTRMSTPEQPPADGRGVLSIIVAEGDKVQGQLVLSQREEEE